MKRLTVFKALAGCLMALGAATALGMAAAGPAQAALPGGTLDPTLVPKYQAPLVIPPVMPITDKIRVPAKRGTTQLAEYYEIAVRQFSQQILPAGYPMTTVWSYGSVNHPGSFNYPAFTIEAKANKPVRVKWINGLVDAAGNYLPHLLPVDQTIHWANPPGPLPDSAGSDPNRYLGPVPINTHLHGAHTLDQYDGYAEGWFLPAALNLPAGINSVGSMYPYFKTKAFADIGVDWAPGTATFQYANNQRASTLWYHDHTLGMTRTNVYAGPAGFYIIRGGPGDRVLDSATGLPATLPGPAPNKGDPAGLVYREVPLAIQDRSFNADGSLFYPADRAFFEGLTPPELQISFAPASDIAPIWNPEFFGNTMVVNGSTWPFMNVEQLRYRFRFLNGCNSRFLILKLVTATNPTDPATWVDVTGAIWQIGAEGGFLAAPLQLDTLLMGPAERADVIVDFAAIPIPAGAGLYLVNVGPDEPFGGGAPGVAFAAADPVTTGQVMQFVVGPALAPDTSTPAAQLLLPPRAPARTPTAVRKLTLNEDSSSQVCVYANELGAPLVPIVQVPGTTPAAGCLFTPDLASLSQTAVPFGPKAARLGVLDANGVSIPRSWMDDITENPPLGATEVWEIHNFTMDAHPIHLHLVQFEVVNRQVASMLSPNYVLDPVTMTDNVGAIRPPETWETGLKDTFISYPGETTRVKATFDTQGLYIWHCHIVEHEDNEMMRPMFVGDPAMSPVPIALPGGGGGGMGGM